MYAEKLEMLIDGEWVQASSGKTGSPINHGGKRLSNSVSWGRASHNAASNAPARTATLDAALTSLSSVP